MLRTEAVAGMVVLLVAGCGGPPPTANGPVPERHAYVGASPGTITLPAALAGLHTGTRAYAVHGDNGITDLVEFRLEQGGSGWTLHTETSNSTGRFEFDAQLASIAYAESWRNLAQGDASAELRDGRITGAARLPAMMGGSLEYGVAAPPGTVFAAMALEVVSAAKLEIGGTLTLPVFTTTTGQIDEWQFEVTAVENVTVPAGTFQAFRVEQRGGRTPQVLYLRQDAPHILLKRVNETQRSTWELQTLTSGE
jgi:hypothetical protein